MSPTVAVLDAAAGVSRRRTPTALAVPAGGTITVGAAAPPPTPERVDITESVRSALTEAPQAGAGNLMIDVKIIEAGWNISGTRYYPADVLARDLPKVLPQGSHSHADHATPTEEAERPERSIQTLAAVLAETPYTRDGGKTMRAKFRVFSPYAQLIREAWRDIGVSINAAGVGEYGERDGRRGLIVTELTEGYSVDFVTRPGAGGRILSLLESARAVDCREARTLGAWLESKLHLALTTYADEMYGNGQLTREERIALSSAIGDGLQAWTARVEGEAPQLFQRDLYDEPQAAVAVTEAADPPVLASDVPAEPAVQDDVPVPATAPADSGDNVTAGATPPAPNPTEGEPDMSGTETGPAPGMAGAATVADTAGLSQEARAQIAEAQLREAQARITVLESQNASLSVERDSVTAELRRVRAAESARTVATTALDSADLPPAARTRVLEAATREVPLRESDGAVNTDALSTQIASLIQAERTYIASIREAAGQGTPSGLGGSVPTQDVPAWQSDIATRFNRLGLSESASKLAAGR